MKIQGGLAFDNNTIIEGIKGPTIMSLLPLIDLSTYILPEFMHSVLLGVTRYITRLWFFIPGPWSIKAHLNNVDKMLTILQAPDSFSRQPRGISYLKQYKASELYYWLILYSIPALEKILPEKYFQHWILLVKSIFLLLQDNISKKNLEEAETLLSLFVKDIEKLYLDRYLTYNIHQLLHLGLSVRRWGPLWATSTFFFEHHNGLIANSINGTKNVGKEIINRLAVANGVKILKSIVKENDQLENNQQFFATALGRILFKNTEDRVYLSHNGFDANQVHMYARAKLNKSKHGTFTSKRYKQLQTNSYTILYQLKNDKKKCYASIEYFFTVPDSNDIFLVFSTFIVEHPKMFYHTKTNSVIKHIIPITEGSKVIVKLSDIELIYKVLRFENYVCLEPNLLHKIL